MEPRLQPLDLSAVRSRPIAERHNLVSHTRFARPVEPDATFSRWFDSLPRLLAVEELRAAVECTLRSHRGGHPVVVALGGHVVKVGLNPLLIDLMERGVIDALVMHGATAIHDYEIALIGETSEDVAAGLDDGSFGMSHETAVAFAAAASRGAEGSGQGIGQGIGLGRALGERILSEPANGVPAHPHARLSLLAAAARLGLPATVHVAMGTDIVHMHPEIDGATLGSATHCDFRLLAALALELDRGTWINMGSAVVLPEVFLKVVNIARNLGRPLAGMTAIDFDLQHHYRTSRNVLERPVQRGISILGHHEINIPLFRLALIAALESEREGSPAP